ncbi:MAG TPA: PadR family transcriptional regulator [Thermoanaerobaculia bacterium]|nr:PadR family transcriptional regulator [Thermoanaerobaculia bacterium]
MGEPDLSLLQGTLDVLVLKALADGPRHGYGVAQWIREVTDEALQIEEGALYTALHRMERRRWLAAEWGLSDTRRRAKYYRLTPAGERQLGAQSRLWNRYAEAVSKVLAGGGARP